MTAMQEQPKPSKAECVSARDASTTVAGDDLQPELGWLSAGRADCCIARALYRVVFRTDGPDPHPAELYLCGHHYRRSTTALLERQAAVYDASHRLLASFA